MTELKFVPFADDSAAATIGELTVENGLSSLVLHGSLVIGRTEEDLQAVRHLIALLGTIEASILEAPAPDVQVEAARVDEVENPF
jgi:hypothetical protein